MILLPFPSSGAVTLADFANAYELKTTESGAIYKIALPRFVYEGLVQSQRRDLAVFNADGQVVPFDVREAEPGYILEELPERRVPFYELPPELNDKNERLDVYVQTGADGQIVSVKGGGGGEQLRGRRYVLDFSSVAADRVEVAKRELCFALPENASVTASIFDSLDLRDWDLLLADAPLVRLNNESSQLLSDRVELPRAPRRYVLLHIRDAEQSFKLNGAGYHAYTPVRDGPFPEGTADIDGAEGAKGAARVNGSAPFAVEYDTLGAFPVSKIQFRLKEAGFYGAKYFSRPSVNDGWMQRGVTELFLMKGQDGTASVNDEISIDGREDRYWRLEFDGAFSGVFTEGALPAMRITWRPADVFFLAQGKAPYVLAFGSGMELPALQNGAFLRGRETSAADAELGEPVSAATPGAAPALRGETAEWQRYMVWGLLILGGLLLSVIALKLLKPGA